MWVWCVRIFNHPVAAVTGSWNGTRTRNCNFVYLLQYADNESLCDAQIYLTPIYLHCNSAIIRHNYTCRPTMQRLSFTRILKSFGFSNHRFRFWYFRSVLAAHQHFTMICELPFGISVDLPPPPTPPPCDPLPPHKRTHVYLGWSRLNIDPEIPLCHCDVTLCDSAIGTVFSTGR